MTGYNLERMAEDLKKILGEIWTVTLFSAKECKKTQQYDPPCAYLEAKCRFGCFTIDIAGEVVNSTEGDWFPLSKKGGHKERVKQLVRWLKETG